MRTFETSIFEKLLIIDPKKAFGDAIKDGLQDPENRMYMNSDNNFNYFKNIDTRIYKKFNYYPLKKQKF